jgi:uncharacterized protein
MRNLSRVLVLCALLASPIAGAEPVTALHFSGYVNDFAHVLNSPTVTELNDTCRELDERAHAQLAVVTVNSLDGRDIEGYAVDLFQRWGIGSQATNRGVLILLAVKDRRYRIEVGYGLEPILPDGKVGGFGREAVPLLKQKNYDAALRLWTLRVATTIAQDAGVQLTRASPAPAPEESGPSGIGFVLLVLAILAFGGPLLFLLWAMMSGSPRDRFGPWGRGGWGGWNVGGFGGGGFSGFGGGGGGGGFGGFGGGLSGGGGASGSW